MKIILAVPSLRGGGAERVVSIWANMLRQRGYEVIVLLLYRSAGEYRVDKGVKIVFVAKTQEEYLNLPYVSRYLAIRRLLTTNKPTYIIPFLHSMQILIMLASVCLSIKRIETMRNNPWIIEKNLSRIRRFLWKLCYRNCDQILLQAAEQKDFFSKEEQKKCILIPNPVSEVCINNYKKVFSSNITNFIAVGRIAPQKNYFMMIRGFAEAVKEYSQLHLKIFGKGDLSYINLIQDYIYELKMQENITLMSFSSSIHEEYIRNDVFLMTSDYEGLSNSLIEAMASQLICITTNCKTGPKDLVDHEKNGFLISTGDYKALSESIKKVISMEKEERVLVAAKARKKILDHCSQEHSIEKLCSIF